MIVFLPYAQESSSIDKSCFVEETWAVWEGTIDRIDSTAPGTMRRAAFVMVLAGTGVDTGIEKLRSWKAYGKSQQNWQQAELYHHFSLFLSAGRHVAFVFWLDPRFRADKSSGRMRAATFPVLTSWLGDIALLKPKIAAQNQLCICFSSMGAVL